jgi:undecaprenyl-diphosphatase
MLEALNQVDQKWLLWLNSHHSPFFDDFFYFVSGKPEWIPLYAIILGAIIWKFKWKTLWIIGAIIVLITLSDQLANVLKAGVKRFRPCKDPDIGHLVHIVNNYCRSSYGFVSGHAANAFALATFISMLFQKKWVTIFMIVWAALVAYSRVYLGVHYPGDIICGAVLGALLALLVYGILRRQKFYHILKEPV